VKLFTVINENQRAIIERLIEMQRKPLKERRGLIKSLESEGYIVSSVGGRYQAASEEYVYRVPLKRCPACQKRKSLAEFLTLRDVEHPWCLGCRHGNPGGAMQAQLERDYYVSQGTYNPGVGQKCQNPECPNDGVIPSEKARFDPMFCSRECWRAVRSGPARFCKGCGTLLPKAITGEYHSRECAKKHTYKFCGNPDCPEQKRIPPHRKYCSKGCATQAQKQQGYFRYIGEKGNESQFVYKQTTGEVPGYAKRRDAVAESNRVNPRRRKAKQ
jgi:hypothetical protein